MPKKLLDSVYNKLISGMTNEGMQELLTGLREIRLNCETEVWSKMVDSTMLTHPIKELIHTDPITRRSFVKPRGYPGDAVLLDMIYGHPSFDKNAVTDVGREIRAFTSNTLAAKAVRYRRKIVAQLIDAVAEKRSKAKILSVACGHLREVEYSRMIKRGMIGDFVAIDQDKKSLQVVRKDYARFGVRARKCSVMDIMRNKCNFGSFDLIYSSGLYDYLEKKIARKLTKRLFDMLVAGGTLMLTNFLPAISAVGFMESYMGWNLTFRDESEMLDLIKLIPRKKIDRMLVFVEKQENIVFLQVHKKESFSENKPQPRLSEAKSR